MSSSSETFRISAEQAEIYEERFVPAIFAQWSPLLLTAAAVGPGHRVLDVACGTGVLARAAKERVGIDGTVVGVDLNDGMLAVARRLRPDLEWRQADVTSLPFLDGSFDAVLCQSALMFFPDVPGALREMARVCAPGGVVGIQVYSKLVAQPAYGPFVEVVARHAGPEAVRLLSTYWIHGDREALRRRVEATGLTVVDVQDHLGRARWSSVAEMVDVEIDGSPLAHRLGAEERQRIQRDAQAVLGQYETGGGAEVPIAGLVVVAAASSRPPGR